MCRKLRKSNHWIHPNKISFDEFIDQLGDNSGFARNIRALDSFPDKRYFEEWMETYARWHDVKTELGETPIEDLLELIEEMEKSPGRDENEKDILIQCWLIIFNRKKKSQLESAEVIKR